MIKIVHVIADMLLLVVVWIYDRRLDKQDRDLQMLKHELNNLRCYVEGKSV